MKLYHATFRAYLPGIKAHGLVPDAQKNWADCAEGFVYLASDLSGSVSFCEAAEDISEDIVDSGICCFEVDTAFPDASCLSVDPNILWEPEEEPWCFVYAGNIPYDALRLCWTEELGEIKETLDSQIQTASAQSSADPGNRTAISFTSHERSL